MDDKLKMRAEVPVAETWDLSLIYATEDAFAQDVEKLKALADEMEKQWKGKLHEAKVIAACLEQYQQLQQLAALTSNFADLAVSVDRYDSAAMDRCARVMSLLTEIGSRLSFIDSELAEAGEEELRRAAELSAGSAGYLMEVLRQKPHRLHPEAERVLAACG